MSMDAATQTTPDQTVTLSYADYADWLVEGLKVRGIPSKVWQGAKGTRPVRVYFGRDCYVEIDAHHAGQGGWYDGAHRQIVGPAPAGLADAITAVAADVVTYDHKAQTVTVTHASVLARAAGSAFGSQFHRCAACGGPSRNGANVLRTDASGLRGWCCSRCDSTPAAMLSFA